MSLPTGRWRRIPLEPRSPERAASAHSTAERGKAGGWVAGRALPPGVALHGQARKES